MKKIVKIKLFVIKDKKNKKIVSIEGISDMYSYIYAELKNEKGELHTNEKGEFCVLDCEAKDANGAIFAKGFSELFETQIIDKEIEVEVKF